MDAFRGCLVVLRIVIGSQVAEFAAPALMHANGFGLTVADLVAPGFLFIMGLAVPVSMSAFLRPPTARGPDGPARRPPLLRIARRAVLLYAIGMFLNAYPFLPEELEHLRFTGVLQRLAVVYLVVSLLYLSCAWSLLPVSSETPDRAHSRFARLLTRGFLLGGFPLVSVALWIVATYTFHNAWPECADVRTLVPDCSLEAYLDTRMWGTEHNFEGGRFDPEGLLSTVVAAVNCWAGLVVGVDVVRNRQRYQVTGGVRRRAFVLVAGGVVCVGAGLALGSVVPIGKQLWTPSFALVTVGIMTAGFGSVLLAFDGGLWPVSSGRACAGATAAVRRGLAPVGGTLVALGRNPLFFYVLSELVIDTLDYVPLRHHGEEGSVWSVLPEVGLASWMPAPLASLVWALLWLLLFYVPLARLLVARGWYIRV
ncbi:heparan-alpha-glucosaminide N-acetyltransferase domain-containing protein [Kitasatospora purpeofusca]|uniref:heparan-alpha-glucosaminide N-acetyltransferase domain-containing protein n=1 Tax=Kitasatospora purpeofusca TaxID=67352 RepID=UPI0035D94700